MMSGILRTVLFVSLAVIIFNNLGQMLALFGQKIAGVEAVLLLIDSAFFAGMFNLLQQPAVYK